MKILKIINSQSNKKKVKLIANPQEWKFLIKLIN